MKQMRVLVPIDLSTKSETVADLVALAGAFHGSITLLHVYEPFTSIESIVPGPGADEDEAAIRAQAQARLEALAEKLRGGGIQVDTWVEAGSPVETILRAARDGGYDLIVMGTQSRSGLERLMLGSVAEGVLRRASCPVVTIHTSAGIRT